MGDKDPAQQAPNAAFAQAINGLVGFLQQQQQQQPPVPPAQQPAAPLLNLFDSDQPFALSTHAGSLAFSQACDPLDTKWDGSVDTFLAFVTSLKLRAREVKCCSQWQPRMRTTFLRLLTLLLLGFMCPIAATTTSTIVSSTYGVTRCFLAGGDRYYMLPGTGYAINTAPDTASSSYAQWHATRSIVLHLSASNPATCFASDTTANPQTMIPIQFSRTAQHSIRIPIALNDLFLLQMNDGYTSFFSDALRYDVNQQSFTGTMYVNESTHSIDIKSGVAGREPHQTFANESVLVEDDESEGDLATHESGQQCTVLPDKTGPTMTIEYNEHANFEPIPNLPHKFEISEEEDPKISRIRHRQMRLATYHEKLRHTSFDILKHLSLAGLIRRDLANVPPPRCLGCQHGKVHRKPWRAKGWHTNNRNIKRANHPGAMSTIKAKEAFERIMADSGVNVLHYHADNGLFYTKAFKQSVQAFCGVNAHHQNGVAKTHVKDVTKGACTMLRHVAHHWPKAVHASLWPCALKHYVDQAGNQSTQAKFEDSPISHFSGTVVELNLNHFHPFGSPVYVLEAALQSGMAHNKWMNRARVSIFLCHSPDHATDVPLILNTQTGLVSPQSHLIYDDDFDTVK